MKKLCLILAMLASACSGGGGDGGQQAPGADTPPPDFLAQVKSSSGMGQENAEPATIDAVTTPTPDDTEPDEL